MSCTRLALAGSMLTTRSQHGLEQHDDRGPEHRAGEVAHAAEDDDGEDRQREAKPNTPGVDSRSQAAIIAPAKAASADVRPNTATL